MTQFRYFILFIILLFSFAFIWEHGANNFDLDDLKAVLISVLVSGAILCFAQLLYAYRLFCLLPKSDENKIIPCLKIILLCQSADIFIPWRGSELLRIFLVKKFFSVQYSIATSTIVLERLIDAMMFFGLMFLLLMSLSNSALPFSGTFVVMMLLFMASFLKFYSFFHEQFIRLSSNIRNVPLRNFFYETSTRINIALKNKQIYFPFFLGILSWGTSVVAVVIYIFLSVIQINASIVVSYPDILIIIMLTFIGVSFSILPANIGVFETALTYGFLNLGVQFDEAIILSIGLHIALLLNGAIGSLIILTLDKELWVELKNSSLKL